MIGSVTGRKTFGALRAEGIGVRHGAVRLRFLPLDVDVPQVAFALGRHFGSAVERNRGRRRMRAAFVHLAKRQGAVPPGAYLLSGSRRLLDAPYNNLVTDLEGCLERLARDA